MSEKKVNKALCPCGSGKNYNECCARFIDNSEDIKDSPIEVLRSRFVANKLHKYEHIIRTWHPDFKPKMTAKTLAREGKDIIYTKLIINNVVENDDTAQIDYEALFRVGNQYGKLTEIANFKKENGVWFYTDGVVGNH